MPSITPPLKGTDAPAPAASDIELRLKALQLAQLEREEAALAEKQQRSTAQARRQAEDAARTEEMRKLAESMCSHRMPDGTSAFGGQWLSNGKLRVVCGQCGKSCYREELSPAERALVDSNMGRFGGSMTFNMSV
jgi:hypothetical protein